MSEKKTANEIKLTEVRTNPVTAGITQKEASAIVGCCENTVYNLEKKKSFWEEVRLINRERVKKEGVGIWKAMIDRALKGSFNHQKLYFELLGDYAQRLEHKDTTAKIDYSKKTPEELADIYEKATGRTIDDGDKANPTG